MRALLLALAIGFGLSVGPRGQAFREDEIECEEAVAKLQDCCDPEQLSLMRCEYIASCENQRVPELNPDESVCIREKSCATIRATDICGRVFTRSQSTPPNAEVSVCP